MEDYAYVLDYLPQGRHDAKKMFRREPVCYAIGENEFKIFELNPKEEAQLVIGERVYIGREVDQREKIAHVRARIDYHDLTTTAQAELPYIIAEIIQKREPEFIEFYNKAQPVSMRFHMLELLPGLGKKTMEMMVAERKRGEYTSLADIKARVPSMHAPEKLIANRVVLELKDENQKYHLFVRR